MEVSLISSDTDQAVAYTDQRPRGSGRPSLRDQSIRWGGRTTGSKKGGMLRGDALRPGKLHTTGTVQDRSAQRPYNCDSTGVVRQTGVCSTAKGVWWFPASPRVWWNGETDPVVLTLN